eukprot:scaffold4421_cov63-Phaeocystis_antarctica.AAC.4
MPSSIVAALTERARLQDHGGVLRLGAAVLQASTPTPGAAQQLSELKLPATGSTAASLLVHTVHAFCTVAAGECGRWVDAERHAQRSLDALRAVPPGALEPMELRWREISARHNALLARLQQVGDAGSETPEVKQRAREQLQLLQEHCRGGVAAGVDAAPAGSLAGLKRCASLLRLAAAVSKLCLRVLGRGDAQRALQPAVACVLAALPTARSGSPRAPKRPRHDVRIPEAVRELELLVAACWQLVQVGGADRCDGDGNEHATAAAAAAAAGSSAGLCLGGGDEGAAGPPGCVQSRGTLADARTHLLVASLEVARLSVLIWQPTGMPAGDGLWTDGRREGATAAGGGDTASMGGGDGGVALEALLELLRDPASADTPRPHAPGGAAPQSSGREWSAEGEAGLVPKRRPHGGAARHSDSDSSALLLFARRAGGHVRALSCMQLAASRMLQAPGGGAPAGGMPPVLADGPVAALLRCALEAAEAAEAASLEHSARWRSKPAVLRHGSRAPPTRGTGASPPPVGPATQRPGQPPQCCFPLPPLHLPPSAPTQATATASRAGGRASARGHGRGDGRCAHGQRRVCVGATRLSAAPTLRQRLRGGARARRGVRSGRRRRAASGSRMRQGALAARCGRPACPRPRRLPRRAPMERAPPHTPP